MGIEHVGTQFLDCSYMFFYIYIYIYTRTLFWSSFLQEFVDGKNGWPRFHKDTYVGLPSTGLGLCSSLPRRIHPRLLSEARGERGPRDFLMMQMTFGTTLILYNNLLKGHCTALHS